MNSYQKNTVTVLDYLSEAGVCQSVYDMSHSCFTKLGRHLSSRKIDFSLEEAEKWLDGLKLSDASIKMYSKAIRQLGDVYNFGHVCFLNRTNLNLKASFDEVISGYLNGISGSYTPSHLKNIRNRCRFFFGFMQMDRGISNPSRIGYEDILSFYLAEDGFVDNYCLGNALPCVSAPSTGIVKILMPEEEAALEGYSEEDQALGLRNRAILLLGLSMGMRGSDITSLTFGQIDWRASSIRFLQEKTDVERVLPMPADAGNALFRYIMEGRPESASGYVFITHKAPYRKIGRGVCRKIMLKALPEEREDGYGFHVTRRTYATKRFRNSCGYSDVAYLIGHSTDDTAKKYISLDEERMRCCPVPLSDAGIPMKGGFRNE